MPATESAVMVGHRNQIVAVRLIVGIVLHVRGHVQVLHRKVDQHIELVAMSSRVREALQMYYEYVGQQPREVLGNKLTISQTNLNEDSI